MSRDILRGLNFWNDFPLLGPEMGWDYIRLPGSALYLFYWLASQFTRDLTHILILKSVLTFFSLFFLTTKLKNSYSALEILFVLFLLICSPGFLAGQRDLWNPSWVFLFNMIIIALFFEYFRSRKQSLLWLAFLMTVLGIEFHFSVAVSFVAGFLTTLSEHRVSRKTVVAIIIISICGLITWVGMNRYQDFIVQLRTIYGLSSKHFVSRIMDILSVNYFYDMPLEDYDLFYFLSTAIKKYRLPGDFSLLRVCFWITNLGFLVALLRMLISAILKRSTSVYEKFLLIYYFIFLGSAFLLVNKEHLPYRYTFLIFPVQFLIIASSLKKIKFGRFIMLLLALAATPQLIYYKSYIDIQVLTGRTHHTSEDGLELTLKNKRTIYNFVHSHFVGLSEPDLFYHLHGRIVNKMRLKEMNWEQTEKYFGLWKFEFGEKAIVSQMDENHYYVSINQAGNVEFENLTSETQPKQVSLAAKRGDQFFPVKVPSGIPITPLRMMDIQAEEFYLEFEVNAPSDAFLQLALDSDHRKPVFSMVGATLNGKVLNPGSVTHGAFLVQEQLQYQLSPGKNSIRLHMKNILKRNSYSRIDIFVTDRFIQPEEIR
jgi:hypothetical protein